MSVPSVPPPLQQFIDDELLRAPLLVDQIADGALDRIRRELPGLAPQPRATAADLLQAIASSRAHLGDYYLRSLRQQIGQRAQAAHDRFGADPAALSLVDEDVVAIDVEISHTIEQIRSSAEYELRELQTYTAALVGDMELSRDHNPFGPATHARALWAAAQALPLSRGHQILFMRHASPALAQALRRSYAAASSRLEAAGVTPAAYRTVIMPSGARRSRRPDASFGVDLAAVRPAGPAYAPAVTQAVNTIGLGIAPLPMLTGERPPSSADPLTGGTDLLAGLFETIRADRRLSPDIALLLARLQAPASRLIQNEPKALEDESHPMWRFVDALGFVGETLPAPGEPERTQTLRFAQGIVEHVAAEPRPASPLFQWATERLQHQSQHRFARRCTAAAAQIAEMQRLEQRLASTAAPPSTMRGALDIAQLDTVPAELMPPDTPAGEPADAAAWLHARRPGDWVNVFLQGRWVKAQVLWPGELGELWLLADAETAETWAVRRRALLTLHAERLLHEMKPRSLVRSAAKRVMRRTLKLS